MNILSVSVKTATGCSGKRSSMPSKLFKRSGDCCSLTVLNALKRHSLTIKMSQFISVLNRMMWQVLYFFRLRLFYFDRFYVNLASDY